MGIGASIFLLALGAILAFAVEADISGLDIGVIGWILMIAGFAGLVITLWFWNSRRRTVVTRQTNAPVAGPGYQSEYREVRRDDVPPPPPPAYS
jgi:Na+/proline symporter